MATINTDGGSGSQSSQCSDDPLAGSGGASFRGDDDDRSPLEPTTALLSPGSYVFTASCLAAVGGLLFGYDTGIISGALLQLDTVFSLTCQQSEFVVSSMLLGALIASLVGGWLVDYWGRRVSILVNCVVFVAGALLLLTAKNYAMLLVGRLVVGFAVSLSAIAECVYISEISPPHRRGLLVSLNELGITVGFLLAYLVNFAFIKVPGGWRWMFGVSAIPAVLQGLGMYFMPTSPRYLMIKGKQQQAKMVLRKIRGTFQVEEELAEIRSSIREQQNVKLSALCSGRDKMRTRMLIGAGLAFLQQVSGEPSVLYYAPTIFQSIGFHSDVSATLATVGLGVIKVLATVVTVLCVDKLGRRCMLLAGVLLMFAGILCIGVVSQVFTKDFQVKDPCDRFPSPNGTANLDRHTRGVSTVPLAGGGGHAGVWGLHNRSHPALQLNQTGSSRLWLLHVGKDEAARKFMEEERWSGARSRGTSFEVKAGPASSEKEDGNGSVSAAGKWVSLVGMLIYIAGYSIGFGPGTWLILSEIFPASLKGRAVSMATVVNWGTNLLVSVTYLQIMSALGVGMTFICYGGVCILSAIFIVLCVPETKGRSLEQLGVDLSNMSVKEHFLANCPCSKCCVQPPHDQLAPYQHMDMDMDNSPGSH